MELIGFNGDILMGVTQPSLSAASLQTNIIPNSYGLSIQPNSNSQIASIQFDAATGWLAIAGNANNNIVKQTITGNGYYQFDIDGQLFSSDRSSASFWESLDGATSISVVGIDFDGGLGDDTLIIGSQEMINFGAIADDTIQIQGEVHGESLFFKAKDIINQGSIIAGNVTAEFSNSYSDVADAKIIASNGGNILLNGGKTGDLEATGQFLATGLTGGKIDFRGKTVSLRGANLDASGQNGGGSILIGGDYQGVDPTGLGTLSNAQFTFVDKYSSINVDAMTRGNGGKVIIWSDGDTDFRGNITARGGLEIGDGGFVEVSGKKNLNFVGQVDVNATNGKQGSILLDPEDIIINPDDDDDSTFDVSDLQKLRGNVTLTATNSIVFNTNTYFINSGGTITLQAPTVNLLGTFGTGGRNLNVSGASIYGMGHINSSSYAGQSGYIKLTSSGGINLGKYAISTNSVQGSGGNITLKANTFITTGLVDTGANGNGNGGNVNLSATAGIFTSTIVTHSTGSGKSGNILLQSTLGSINTTNSSFDTDDRLIYAAGNGGSAGSVTLTAYSDIVTNSIRASSNGGAGNTIKLTSLMGKIDTNGGLISSTSLAGGNAGAITLNSAKDIKVGDIFARSRDGEVTTTGVWNGGRVTLDAGGNIESGNITTTSIAGNAGKVTLEAGGDIEAGAISSNTFAGSGKGGNVTLEAGGDIEVGNITTTSITGNAGIVTLEADLGIKVGNVDTFTVNAGDAGNVRLTTLGFDSDITALAIKTNAFGNGEGGGVRITSGGDILVDSIRADSIGGIGGDIRLVASKTVQVTSSFSVNGEDYSIYTDSVDDASGAKGASVTIQHSSKIKNIPSPFIVGDSSVNGTFGAVSDGVIGLITEQGRVHEIDNNFDLSEIHIKGNNFLASQSALLSALGFSTAFLSYAFKDNKAKLDNARNLYLLGNVGGFTLQQLKKIATDDTTYGVTIPSLDVNNAQKLLKAGLNFYLYLYGITTPRTQGHFIAQSLHETGGFKSFGEINSGVSGFDVGRGMLQLTGKENYRDFGTYVGIAGLEKIPQVVSSDTGLTILSAMWYWSVQYATSSQGSLNSIAEMNEPTVATVDLITSKINYGEINIDPSLSPEYKITLQQNTQKRKEYFLNAKRVLGIT